MARIQGFARGDFDTSFPLDDKFLALRGRLTGTDYYAAVGVYFTVLAAGWREAARRPAIRTTPDAEQVIAILLDVGLLDPEQMLPRRAFEAWVGRAKRQRNAATVRKRANRAGMSHVTDGDGSVTPMSVPRESATPQGRVGTRKTVTGRDGRKGGPGGSLDGLHHVTDAVAAAWEAASGRGIFASGAFAQEYIDGAAMRHPEQAVVDAIGEARAAFDHIPDASPLAAAVRAILDPFVQIADHRADAEAEALDRQRREADQQRRERLKLQTHERGAHDGDPDPGCPECRKAGAA